MTVTEASKALKVGERGIRYAKLVLEEGTPEEIAAPQWESRKSLAWRDMTQSQRAAVAVEQASFYPRGKPKENYKDKFLPLNEIADANGITRPMIVWAKAVWDAAEASGDMKKGPSAKPYQK